MTSPHVYDKGKYHDDFFLKESGGTLEQFRSGTATIHDLYDWWDRCLIDEMLSAYQALRQVIDRRYDEWKKPRKRWWPF